MMRQRFWKVMAALALMGLGWAVQAQTVRIKDLGRFSSMRENSLVGYGIVTGLAGTGDTARNKVTRQTLANVLSRFDMTISSEDVQSRNVAAVMLSAAMPLHSRPGETLDVKVTSVGDARSLAGGVLLMAPLKGADGRVYALAQGALTVGGFRYDANNNLQIKNHPTAALISGGATVEVAVNEEAREPMTQLSLVLNDADYTTASRIAEAINANLGKGLAEVRDAGGVDIQVPPQHAMVPARFIRQVEALSVEPDRRARVVINERTGTVVAGGDVRISKVSVAHGDLKVSVQVENNVSQPGLVIQPGPQVRTQAYSNTQITVDEGAKAAVVPPGPTTVSDLVQAMAKMKISTRDMIAVLQAVKAAGALHAELVVQ